ncbi:unnamed protein product [Scytosiphon promiscuus]
MQQATELNQSIREMHAFLRDHFLEYVDIHHCLLSKRSLMTDEERDLLDLEVASFMTACAAGVDALKASLQRERLRRMEQESAAARAVGEDDGRGFPPSGEGGLGGGGLRPGSRPAHEHAAVTFLFERLKAVTEVAETMQASFWGAAPLHARAAASKARFYGGPAESNDVDNDDGASRGGYPSSSRSAAAAAATSSNVWKPTPEELEEERLLRQSLPAAYGDDPSSSSPLFPPDSNAGEDIAGGITGGLAGFASALTAATAAARPGAGAATPPAAAAAGPGTPQPTQTTPAETPGTGAAGAQRRPASAEEKRRAQRGNRQGSGVVSETASAVRRSEGSGGDAAPVVSAAVLEGESRDLVARLKNELDDARLVETKMSEISGLMGLFANKVVEQQGGMEHVFDTAVSVNDKLVRGGQHLEKAVKRGGAFRLFYAWFMIGASFCLLFLHFFNP